LPNLLIKDIRLPGIDHLLLDKNTLESELNSAAPTTLRKDMRYSQSRSIFYHILIFPRHRTESQEYR